MESDMQGVVQQIIVLTGEISKAYEALKSAQRAEAMSRVVTQRQTDVDMNGIFLYNSVDEAIENQAKAKLELDKSISKVIELLPKSLIADMRNTKKKFVFDNRYYQVALWFDNFAPKVEVVRL